MIGKQHSKCIPSDAIEPPPIATVTRRDTATLVEGVSGSKSLHPLFINKSIPREVWLAL